MQRLPLTFLLVVLMYASLQCSHAGAQQLRTAICYDQAAGSQSAGVRVPLVRSLQRIATALGSSYTVELRARACPQIPSATCFGTAEAIFCREEAFAILSRGATLIAAEETILRTAAPAGSGLERTRRLTWIDVYKLASAWTYLSQPEFTSLSRQIGQRRGLTTADLSRIVTLAAQLYQLEQSPSEPRLDSEESRTGLRIYRSTIDYALAFLYGHELAHYFQQQCPASGDPLVKQRGVWDTAVALQRTGGLFRPLRMDLAEVQADRCGLRVMESVHRAITARVRDADAVTRARRGAIDLLAGPVLLGMQGRSRAELMSSATPQLQVYDGYLYPQTRLILAASTLRSVDGAFAWAVRLCDDTGKAMATIIQSAFSSYAGSNGDVPDAVLEVLPSGVSRGWETGRWDQNSFKCVPGGRG